MISESDYYSHLRRIHELEKKPAQGDDKATLTLLRTEVEEYRQYLDK